MWELKTLVLLFVGALIISATGIWLILHRVKGFGIDAPDDYRKKHDKPVSRLGGLPIFVALSIGFLTLAIRIPEFLGRWTPVIIANALIFSIGFLDDLKPLGARIKLVGQIGAALVLYSLGVSIDRLSNPFGEGALLLGWWSLPVTVLWLIAVPNIINLIDGMDGLASGFGMFLCLTLASVGHFSYMPDVVLVSMVMAGALGGFLIFNFPPAKIFLGDGGAYLIGFFVASVSLMSSNKGSIIASLLVMTIALGVPILDTFFAIIRRAVRGLPLFRADAEHIHHRLITLGYSKRQALLVMYTVCLILSLAGLSLLMARQVTLPVVGAAVLILALVTARYLGYVRSWSSLRDQFRQAMARRRELVYVRTHGALLEMEIERCDAEQFAAVLQHTLDRLQIRTEPAANHIAIQIPLPVSAKTVTLYRPDPVANLAVWSERTTALQAALDLAEQKWTLHTLINGSVNPTLPLPLAPTATL